MIADFREPVHAAFELVFKLFVQCQAIVLRINLEVVFEEDILCSVFRCAALKSILPGSVDSTFSVAADGNWTSDLRFRREDVHFHSVRNPKR